VEKDVLRPEWNRAKEEVDRRAIGKEFQTVGAAKKKERRPWADWTEGISCKCWFDDRRERENVWDYRQWAVRKGRMADWNAKFWK
jgi:hypothetical protein